MRSVRRSTGASLFDQDYEPLFHPASTQQALAAETYSLDYLPIVNSQWLHTFLVRERIGRFAEPAFVERSLVFQPAVDCTLFFPAFDRSTRARRRLLFYARPTNGLRTCSSSAWPRSRKE